MDKINRVAENLGIDENFAAAVREHLKNIGYNQPGVLAEIEAARELADLPEGRQVEQAENGATEWMSV
jgi:hypothetical protein